MKHRTTLTQLICLKCGNIDTIQRQKRHLKQFGRIKDLWCFKCKDTTKHYEIKDMKLFMFKDVENDLDLYVKCLLDKELYQEQNQDDDVKKLIR